MAAAQDESIGASGTAERGAVGIRARAVIVGFLLCFPVAYATQNQSSSSMFSLMVAPISALMALLAVNWVLKRAVPFLAFTRPDLIVCYILVSLCGCLAGEWTNTVEPMMLWLADQVKTNATVRDTMMKQLPDNMYVKSPAAIEDIYGGGKDWHYANHQFLHLVLPRLFPWMMLLGAVVLGMQFLNSLMRNAWCEKERLSFPLIQLPVAMCDTEAPNSMWRSKFMWIAFAVMFSIDILNGLNYLYPNLPSIPVKTLIQIDPLLKDPPLSNIGDFRISIFPFMAAIGLFMPSDMLFSFVMFFLLRKLTHVILAANGIPQQTFSGSAIAPGPPYFDEQTWGAVFGLFLGAVWVSREYLRSLWKDIIQLKPSRDGGIKPAYAFAGLVACSAVFIGYCVSVGQFPFYYAFLYIVAFYIFAIVVTRVRAQLGPPTHEFAFFGVNALLGRFLGNRWLTDPQAVWSTSALMPMNRIYRNFPMPYQLEAMKMGQMEKIRQRPIGVLIAIAALLGIFLCFYFHTIDTYRTGSLSGADGPGYLDKILTDRHGPDVSGMVMTIFGFAVVMVLDAIRFKFPNFPLHPAGYFLSMNFGVDYYWFGLLLAMFVKNFVQRYYGLSGYDKLRAVALGILLGEYAAETIWMAMAVITHQSTYTIGFNDRSLGVQ